MIAVLARALTRAPVPQPRPVRQPTLEERLRESCEEWGRIEAAVCPSPEQDLAPTRRTM